eukprot:6378955-Prymnesium_polylepis.1
MRRRSFSSSSQGLPTGPVAGVDLPHHQSTPLKVSFCTPSTPLNAARGAEASGLLPEAEDAAEVARELHEGCEQDEVDGVLLPHYTKKPHDAFGITAHWQSATQDVDFER